jgi:GTP diphosphokinase / guanosine-3',5'-bis(diphosphate) 3'-diphosphatase
MIRFEDLVDKVRTSTPDADVELLRRAYVFSALEHKGQVRHSGEPYLVHPLEVANILADMRLDVVAIASGLLHDVVEDTLTTIDRIEELFGADVAHVVEGVTKLSAIPFSSSEERQAENFRKMLLAMVDDIRVMMVKLADRLHNMRTLDHLSEERRTRIAQETLDIYAPIANRLGMSKVKNELEELAFKATDSRAYASLTLKVESRRRVTEGAIEELKRTIRLKLDEAQIPVREIEGRIKRLYSIFLKLKRQKIDLEQVYDLVAIRIVTDSPKDCYGALGIIHQTWQPIPGRIKDFIAMPRPNGYQSLHTSVVSDRGLPFEVQIRTHAPDRGGRHRRALEVQGRARRRAARRAVLPLAAAVDRVAAGDPGSARVHPEPQDRSLSGGGLLLHAARRGEGAAARSDAGRFRLRDSHRHRPPVRGCAGERQHGAAPQPSQER